MEYSWFYVTTWLCEMRSCMCSMACDVEMLHISLPSKSLIAVEGHESLAVSAGVAGAALSLTGAAVSVAGAAISREELLFGLCLRESSLSEWLYINMGMDSSPFPGQKRHT